MNGLLSSKSPFLPKDSVSLQTHLPNCWCWKLWDYSYINPTRNEQTLPTFLSFTNSALGQGATRTLIDPIQSNLHPGVSFKTFLSVHVIFPDFWLFIDEVQIPNYNL